MADADHIAIKLSASLSALTEEDYVHLANRGLLRRAQKELDNGAVVEIVTTMPEGMELRVGPHTVTLPASGPNKARCSCPAPGVCQHVLMACLRVPALVNGETAQEPTVIQTISEAADEEEAPGVREDLLEISMTELRAWAGLPNLRAGIRLVLECDQQWIVREGAVAQIEIPRAKVNCRCPPGVALDGIMTSAAPRNRKAHVVAAVLAYQFHHGRRPDLLLAEGKHPAATGAPAHNRQEVLAGVRALLQNTLDTGLSHLSFAQITRYSGLAYAAQGARLYRLSLLLKSVADEIEQLLDRMAQSDTEELLDKLATAHALVEAIEGSGDILPVWLAGQARRQYEDSETLNLAGLGGYAWNSPSGYVGLTLLFLEMDGGEILTWSDVRPETATAGFDPVKRFEELCPWRGGVTIRAISQSLIQLHGARLNEEGRISGTEETLVEVQAPAGLPAIQKSPRLFTDWEALAKHSSENRSLGLRRAPPARQAVIVQPARWGPHQFDETTQAFSWLLLDQQGRELPIWIEYGKYDGAAIESLEELSPGRGDCVAGVIRHTPIPHLYPISILRGVGNEGALSLGLKQSERRNSSWWQKITQRFTLSGGPVLAGEAEGSAGIPRQQDDVLYSLSDFILAKAEGGTRRFSEEDRVLLDTLARQLERLGFVHLGQVAAYALNARQPLCRSVLVLRYLLGVHAQIEG